MHAADYLDAPVALRLTIMMLTIIVEYFRNDLPTTLPSRFCHAPFYGRTTSRGRKQKQGGSQPTHQKKGTHFAQHELILTHLLPHGHSTGCASIAGRNKRKKARSQKRWGVVMIVELTLHSTKWSLTLLVEHEAKTSRA